MYFIVSRYLFKVELIKWKSDTALALAQRSLQQYFNMLYICGRQVGGTSHCSEEYRM